MPIVSRKGDDVTPVASAAGPVALDDTALDTVQGGALADGQAIRRPHDASILINNTDVGDTWRRPRPAEKR